MFGDPERDPRRSMEHLGTLKTQAVHAWEDFLSNDRAHTLRERPFGSYPITTWALSWPLTKKARGDSSSLVGYYRHFEA